MNFFVSRPAETLETHPESPPATMGSGFRGPNGGLEKLQKV